jgi:predicted ATPase
MIRKLVLESFKCFATAHLPMSELVLLTGINSGGKSTTLQALLFLHQALAEGVDAAQIRTELALNGELLALGRARDVVGRSTTGRGFSVGVFDDKAGITWLFEPHEDPTRALTVDVVGLRCTPKKSIAAASGKHSFVPKELAEWPQGRRLLESLVRLKYVPADRIGPAETYALPNEGTRGTFGARAANAVGWMHLRRDDDIPTEALRHPNPSYNKRTPRQVEAWLADLFPGLVLELLDAPRTNLVTLLVRTNEATDFLRPHNVGFGVTAVLPAIVALVTSAVGDLVIIENPEAHLHPRAQVRFALLCARAASAGIQVIVETHSDHIINGVRVAVHDGELAPELTRILFFSPDEDNQVTQIGLDRHGRLDRWPAGFGDETERLLGTLLHPIEEE